MSLVIVSAEIFKAFWVVKVLTEFCTLLFSLEVLRLFGFGLSKLSVCLMRKERR